MLLAQRLWEKGKQDTETNQDNTTKNMTIACIFLPGEALQGKSGGQEDDQIIQHEHEYIKCDIEIVTERWQVGHGQHMGKNGEIGRAHV